MKNEIFEGCNELTKIFGEVLKKKKEMMETLEKDVDSANNLLLDKLQNNLLSKCTSRDWEFLNLRTTDEGTLLSSIFRSLVILESTVPGLYELKFQSTRVEITDSEINNGGFYFDSGRSEIRNITNNLSEILGLSINAIFYPEEKQILALWLDDENSE